MTADSATTVRIEDGVLMVGERAFPWASGIDQEDSTTPSIDWRTRRARLTFENGWTLSIVWGHGTYGSNYEAAFDRAPFVEEATTVEVWGWDRNHEVHISEDPFGWVAADRLLVLIDGVSAWPSSLPSEEANQLARALVGEGR